VELVTQVPQISPVDHVLFIIPRTTISSVYKDRHRCFVYMLYAK